MTTKTPTDDKDARHALQNESLTTAAQSIKDGHAELMASKDQAREAILSTCEAALKVSAVVEQVHAQLGGPRFSQWWRDQGMPVGWAQRYLTLAKTKRAGSLDDKSQLRLVGILPEPQGGNPGQRRQHNPFEWTKWTGKIARNFEAVDLEELDEADVYSTLKHLEPIKNIIQKLEARTQ